MEFGFPGLGDGLSSLGFGCADWGLLMESLLFGGVAAVLGEGLDFWAAAEDEDSHRDLRWWEAAELGGLGALPPAMFMGFFLLPIDSYSVCSKITDYRSDEIGRAHV